MTQGTASAESGTAQSLEDQASEQFVRKLHGPWSEEQQAALEQRLAASASFAGAYARIEASWRALDAHAEAPEVVAYREEALVSMRRAGARRWQRVGERPLVRGMAIAAALLLALGIAWQLSPYGYRPGLYRTGIDERRTLDLPDRSRISLDAATRLQVKYSDDARVVHLLEGQAQFSVAKDPARPFKVQAGNRTIVAVGTVFTVEYVDHAVHVTTLEGRVAVITRGEPAAAPSARPPELRAGEEMHVRPGGEQVVTVAADLGASTAWLNGKVIFRGEELSAALRRLNRYSRVQIEIEDPALGSRHISGVFDAGDTDGFVSAIQRYLPVTADYSQPDVIVLKRK